MAEIAVESGIFRQIVIAAIRSLEPPMRKWVGAQAAGWGEVRGGGHATEYWSWNESFLRSLEADAALELCKRLLADQGAYARD